MLKILKNFHGFIIWDFIGIKKKNNNLKKYIYKCEMHHFIMDFNI